MREASKELQFEKAARLRDEIKALETLNLRGNLAKHAQPEVFYVDPRKGLKGLKKVLKLDSIPRTIDGVDIAHLGGTEMVGSLVTFIDGLPFKPGYRRYQIKSVAGHRRFRRDPRGRHAADQGPAGARRAVPRHLADRRRQGPALRRPWPPSTRSRSSRRPSSPWPSSEEEIYVPGPVRPDRALAAGRSPCGCCNTSATRPTASPSITTTCSARSGRWETMRVPRSEIC